MLPRSGNPGYITGAPLLIANSGAVQHVSLFAMSCCLSLAVFLFLVLHCVDFYSAPIGIWGEWIVKNKMSVVCCLFILLFGFLMCSLSDEHIKE